MTRTCEGPHCPNSMAGRSVNARFCSDRCRAAAWKIERNYGHHPSSPQAPRTNGADGAQVRGLTQVQRVLRLLKQRGPRGVTAVDFALPDVADGAKPIMRLAARVGDLRDRGVPILTVGERDGVAVYVLPGATPAPQPRSVSAPTLAEPSQANGVLFEYPPPTSPGRHVGAHDHRSTAA